MAKTKRAQEALDVDRELYSGLIRLHVLHHAAEEPIFGLGMLEELSRHGYRISPGTLYPILHGLEKKGYCVRPSGATENLCVDYTGYFAWNESSQGRQKQGPRAVSRTHP